MKNVLLLLGTLFVQKINAQTEQTALYIYLAPDTAYYEGYYPFRCQLGDTNTVHLTDSKYFNYILSDCNGAMTVRGYTNGVLTVQGQYSNSIDTFKHCVVVNDGHDPKQPMVVTAQKYLEPLKTGTWLFYNLSGTLVRTEIWDRGVCLKTISNN